MNGETMTSLGRVRATLDGRIPDRVPVCLLAFPNTARHAGLSMAEFCLDGEKMARAHMGYWEEFRHDMIQLGNGIAALAEAAGCKVAYPDEQAPWIVRPALSSLEDIDRLREMDLHSPAIRALLHATELLSREIGDSVCIRGDSDQGPFSLASQILGYEEFLIALIDPARHECIRRLLQYAADQIVRFVRAQYAAGSHATVIGDSIAGRDVCSPRLYREFSAPYERAVADRLRADGFDLGIHICGNATSIVGDMVDTGANCFELDYKVDRAAGREAARGRATLIGTLDPANLIARGTPEGINAVAAEDIRLLAPGGRFILGAGCTIPRDTPAANVHALVRAAREHGRYTRDGWAFSD